jgi:hypothetical protein
MEERGRDGSIRGSEGYGRMTGDTATGAMAMAAFVFCAGVARIVMVAIIGIRRAVVIRMFMVVLVRIRSVFVIMVVLRFMLLVLAAASQRRISRCCDEQADEEEQDRQAKFHDLMQK